MVSGSPMGAPGTGARSPTAPIRSTACLAPSHELYLMPDGDVRACCRNLTSLGNIGSSSLSAIWNGRRRADLVRRLGDGDYSGGCRSCEVEVTLEGRRNSFSATFDHWLQVEGAVPEWPARIEFNLSNACNLQCVQCSGELSSSIRAHRERRPPLPTVYGDEFFEDLRGFVPHLRSAGFAGGEPFLGAENYRVYELIAELAPTLPCTIVTNGTQWNDRVEHVLESLRVHPVVSLDSPFAATYERIRVGADHAAVVRNIDRLNTYRRAAGTTMSLNFCLMPENVLDFPDMLLFAEERGLRVNVCVVRAPVEHSLARLAPSEVGAVRDALLERHDEMEGALELNRDCWGDELARLLEWSRPSASDRSHWTEQSPMIMMFPRDLPHGPDVRGAGEAPPPGPVAGDAVFELEVGPDDLVTSAPAGLEAALGLEPGSLEGRTLAAVMPAMRRFVVLDSNEHVYRADFELSQGSGHVHMVPRRDANGRAGSVAVTFVVRSGPVPPGAPAGHAS